MIWEPVRVFIWCSLSCLMMHEMCSLMHDAWIVFPGWWKLFCHVQWCVNYALWYVEMHLEKICHMPWPFLKLVSNKWSFFSVNCQFTQKLQFTLWFTMVFMLSMVGGWWVLNLSWIEIIVKNMIPNNALIGTQQCSVGLNGHITEVKQLKTMANSEMSDHLEPNTFCFFQSGYG